MSSFDRNVSTIYTNFVFSYHHDLRSFTAEASDFYGTGKCLFMPLGKTNRFGIETPIGFILKSHKTEKNVPMVLVKIERDNEGNTLAWRFEPLRAEDTKLFNHVVVFND